MLEILYNVLTSKGAALEAQCRAGGHIEFTRFAIGNGTYSGSESISAIEAMTALRNEKDTFGVSNVEVVNHDTCALTLVATNLEVTAGYYISEIGIFAKGDDGKEILYEVIVAQPDARDWFPAYNSRTPGSITYNVYISVGNAEHASIDVDAGGVALAKDLEALETKFDSLGLSVVDGKLCQTYIKEE